jgi:hypothetical protein
VVEELVCYRDRIVIPAKLRPQVLKTIHAAHQGVSGMISRVEDEGGLLECLTCVRDTPSQPAGSPVATPTPSFPFQFVVGDYFSLAGVNYLVLGDRFLGGSAPTRPAMVSLMPTLWSRPVRAE